MADDISTYFSSLIKHNDECTDTFLVQQSFYKGDGARGEQKIEDS